MPPDIASNAQAPLTAEVGHYENFPVASLLCPPVLRPTVAAIYHFARTADDIADEGEDSTDTRLKKLEDYRGELNKALNGEAPSSTWPHIFKPLTLAIRQHQLPGELLHDLLSAFEQDVRHTASGHLYADLDELLAYCRLSANPVGRLLLHLYGVHDASSLAQSDHICSALQLINFWQDLSVDLPRQRHYLPQAMLLKHGLTLADFHSGTVSGSDPATSARKTLVLKALCADARTRMLDGAPLALQIKGRAGWELRLVVQGGLRILDKIAAQSHQSWAHRPTLNRWDLAGLLWRAVRM